MYYLRFHTKTFACYLVLILVTLGCSNPKSSASYDTDWEFQSLRSEIDPGHWVSEEVQFEGTPTLVLSGDNKEYVNGRTVIRTVHTSKFYNL